MKIRNKKTLSQGNSSRFNTHALSEIIVCSVDGDCFSEFISECEVFIPNMDSWVDMYKAFQDNLIIPDNHNTSFREPLNDEERKRGFYY